MVCNDLIKVFATTILMRKLRLVLLQFTYIFNFEFKFEFMVLGRLAKITQIWDSGDDKLRILGNLLKSEFKLFE